MPIINFEIMTFQEKILQEFAEHHSLIIQNDIDYVSRIRESGIRSFQHLGLPNNSMESWRNTSLEETLSHDYELVLKPAPREMDINSIFRCEVHNFETYLFTQLNGWYVYENTPITVLPEGVVVGSLAHAFKKYSALIEKHYGKYADMDRQGLTALNTAFAQDGIFIYVPDGVSVDKPIQMVNVISYEGNLMVQPRNLIILGKNSHLTLVHCDDSIQHQRSFINTVSEYYIAENASLDHYKLQNKDDSATLITSNFFHQERSSRLNTNIITLNGGLIRNNTYLKLNGEACDADVSGLYLMDRKQHVDNQVYIDHVKPNCTSNELFKGIIDEEASAVFNGHIIVRPDAQKTNAFQNNRNILLTDTAKINSKPFLEIYADDVKCSHGATVGQLDSEAMFYLKSRGICERNAKMLLMYAFAAEVIQKISIETLRERLDEMVKKRLRGELSICDQCVLHCKDQLSLDFAIDMTKI